MATQDSKGTLNGVSVTPASVGFALAGGTTSKTLTVSGDATISATPYTPAGTDVAVTDGGTGRSTGTTAYALVATGTTATGAQQSLAAGATTEVLVGGGASALPVWTTATGSGAPVRATSPTLVTPLLGTPTSGTLTNCTGLPVAGGGTGRATGTTAYALVATGTTATGAQQSLAAGATTEILVGGGASALPVWTTVTGTGAPVRATSPTLVTPLLGTPTSGDLQNCTAGNETTKGVLELATTAEAITGTDTARAVTAAGLTAHLTTPKPIGETTPNSIRGTNKEVFFTATDTADAAECAGTVVSNYGMTDADMVLTLPAAAEGLGFVCVLPAVRARYVRLTSAGTDKIYLAGIAGTGPGYVGVASGYATGSSCSMFTFKASDGGYDWFCMPLFGAWIAG